MSRRTTMGGKQDAQRFGLPSPLLISLSHIDLFLFPLFFFYPFFVPKIFLLNAYFILSRFVVKTILSMLGVSGAIGMGPSSSSPQKTG